jgi:TetR/AcrR family transcriptional regulator, repressor for uid operon
MTKPSHLPNPLGRPANPEARAQRRAQIIEGARTCFLRKGFHAATTAEISAEAGVSVANLYQYFPTKDDLVQALIEDDLAEDLALVRLVDEAGSLREGLARIDTLLAAEPDYAEQTRLKLEIIAEAARNPQIAAVVRAADARMVAAMITLLERRQQAGEVRAEADPAVIAELILALYDGLYGRLAFSGANQARMTRAASQMIIDAFANPPHPSG